jgi:hypothetical protein
MMSMSLRPQRQSPSLHKCYDVPRLLKMDAFMMDDIFRRLKKSDLFPLDNLSSPPLDTCLKAPPNTDWYLVFSLAPHPKERRVGLSCLFVVV